MRPQADLRHRLRRRKLHRTYYIAREMLRTTLDLRCRRLLLHRRSNPGNPRYRRSDVDVKVTRDNLHCLRDSDISEVGVHILHIEIMKSGLRILHILHTYYLQCLHIMHNTLHIVYIVLDLHIRYFIIFI